MSGFFIFEQSHFAFKTYNKTFFHFSRQIVLYTYTFLISLKPKNRFKEKQNLGFAKHKPMRSKS